MEKLQQIDVDRLEKVMSNLDAMIEHIESVVYSKKANKVRLAYFVGRLSQDLFDQKTEIQDIVNKIYDNDLIKDDIENLDYGFNKSIDDELPF